MFRLRVDQHAQILGFALIGYGVGLISTVLNALWQFRRIDEASAGTPGDLYTTQVSSQILGVLFCAILAVAAGVVIRTMSSDPRIVGILFVCAAITAFPLGTILTAYVLIYLFAIYPEESEPGLSSIIGN